MKIKYAQFAGGFYPQDRVELNEMLSKLFEQARENDLAGKVGGKLKALICPHAGYVYSGLTAAIAYNLLGEKSSNGKSISGKILEGPKDIIIIAPSHRSWFSGIACCDFDSWGTPLGEIKAGGALELKGQIILNNKVFNGEHSIEVQLPFLQTILKDFSIYPLLTGEIIGHNSIANQLEEFINDNTLLVISSDLSHYHNYEEAKAIDKNTVDQISKLDASITHEQACGADGINILINIAIKHNWKPVLLDLRNSFDTGGEIYGQKDSVVGYCAFAFVEV